MKANYLIKIKIFKVGRYHSLKLYEPYKSNNIKITMRCVKSNIPMAFEDKKNNIFGFQFHPEIIERMILSWNIKSAHMLNKLGSTSTKNQLKEHKKYSDSVKDWFIPFLKSWIEIK